MATPKVNPHSVLYSQLQKAAGIFNKALFDGKLDPFVLTLQRGRNTSGYFSPDQWGNTHGDMASEIAINPCYLANQSLLILFQTIVHELCHLWQHQYGRHKPRPGYHNQEWAEKMERIGLIPSATGDIGGKKIGQKMADYPSPDGEFMQVSRGLVESGFGIDWVDRDFNIEMVSYRSIPAEVEVSDKLNSPLHLAFPELVPLVKVGREEKKKIKYFCPKCTTKVWGKLGLKITCTDCELPLESGVKPPTLNSTPD